MHHFALPVLTLVAFTAHVVNADQPLPPDLARLLPRVSWNSKGSIERFIILGNDISTAHLQSISKLQELNDLRFASAHLTDSQFAQITDLPKLRRLFLCDNPISDRTLEVIGTHFRDLEVLDLSRTRITDKGLGELPELSHLRELYLVDCGCGNSGLEAVVIPHSETLELLDLTGTGIDDDGIAFLARTDLPRLVELSIGATRVSDEGVRRIASIKRLRVLSLVGSNVSRTSVADLLERRPELSVLPMSLAR